MGVYITTYQGKAHKEVGPSNKKKLKQGNLILLDSNSRDDLILAVFDVFLGRGIKANKALYLKPPIRFEQKWAQNVEEIKQDLDQPVIEYPVDKVCIGDKEIINHIKSLEDMWNVYSVLI